jgi:SAM-dependent methyltransferase
LSSSSYVTDVGYPAVFIAGLAPDWLDLTALISGFAAPTRNDGFAFCDLGCGRGLTAAVLAATHRDGAFHAVDLMPEHIAYARRLVERAGIGNLTLHEMDFAGAARLDLPHFQYIVAHGVYSWTDAQAREDLRRFVDRHLAPGGLVYLSYNAMPGWAADLPFRQLVATFARRAPGDSIERFAAAEAALRRLSAAGMPALRISPMFMRALAKQRRRLPVSYFAHEYLPAWQPFYVTEVRAELATIGLRPVGSATLADNFDSFVLRAAQRDALAEIDDDDLRELVRDCMLMTRFRRDVFCRDAAPINEDEQRRNILHRRFALVLPESVATYSMKTQAGSVRFDNPLARHVVAALAHGPQPLRSLGHPASDLVMNALALASAGIIYPVNKRDTAVSALNSVLVEFDSEVIPLPFRALPSGTALELEPALHRSLRKRGRLPRRLRAWPDFLAQATEL